MFRSCHWRFRERHGWSSGRCGCDRCGCVSHGRRLRHRCIWHRGHCGIKLFLCDDPILICIDLIESRADGGGRHYSAAKAGLCAGRHHRRQRCSLWPTRSSDTGGSSRLTSRPHLPRIGSHFVGHVPARRSQSLLDPPHSRRSLLPHPTLVLLAPSPYYAVSCPSLCLQICSQILFHQHHGCDGLFVLHALRHSPALDIATFSGAFPSIL